MTLSRCVSFDFGFLKSFFSFFTLRRFFLQARESGAGIVECPFACYCSHPPAPSHVIQKHLLDPDDAFLHFSSLMQVFCCAFCCLLHCPELPLSSLVADGEHIDSSCGRTLSLRREDATGHSLFCVIVHLFAFLLLRVVFFPVCGLPLLLIRLFPSADVCCWIIL